MSTWDDMRALMPDNITGDISAADMRSVIDKLEAVDADNVKGPDDVRVYLEAGSTTDLADTITAIVDATHTKRYFIELGAGEHLTKAVTMKSYVFVSGAAEDAVTVTPTATNITMFTMADSSGLSNLIISGASLGTGVSWTGSGYCYLNSITVQDCQYGVTVNGSNSNMMWVKGSFSGTLTTGFECYQGNVTLSGVAVSGLSTLAKVLDLSGPNVIATVNTMAMFSTNVTTGIHCSDNSQTVINSPSIVNASGAGLQVDTTARTVIKGGNIFECGVGVYMPDDGTVVDVELTGCTVLNNTDDFQILNDDAKVRLGTVVTDAFNSVLGSQNIKGLITDETEGDEGVHVYGKLKVGTPAAPAETVLGEGDSYAGQGRAYVYTWNGTSWADITDDASSASGSTFEFPNGSVNSAIYIASRYPQNGTFMKHGGFKMDVVTNVNNLSDLVVSGTITPDSTGSYDYWRSLNGKPAFKHSSASYWISFSQGMWCIFSTEPTTSTSKDTAQHSSTSLLGSYSAVSGTGTATVAQPAFSESFVIEYYDGSAWQSVNYMITDATNSYHSYAKEIFQHTGTFQVRYDLLLDQNRQWETSDFMGLGPEYYWIRIRIDTAITTSPVLEQLKIHSNRTEVNEDGYIEFFGKARPFNRLPLDPGLVQNGVASPGDMPLVAGTGLDRGYKDNLFASAVIDRIGFNTFLPPQVDTSTPVRFSWSVTTGTSGGDVVWNVRYGWSQDGSIVETSGSTGDVTVSTVQLITTMPTTKNEQITFDVDLDISEMQLKFGDILWITLERDGTDGNDTHSGDIALINVCPRYCQYVLGGHI